MHADRLNNVPVARQLARTGLAMSGADLPPAVVEKIKILILDYLACCFEARDLPWSDQAMATITPLGEGSPIIGTAIRTSPLDAAFVNATMGHGLVREDMHAASICHLGVVVQPTLLALAGTNQYSGAQFMAAMTVGYETGARIGKALFNAELAKLYRPTGTVVPLGAALAGCHLLGLDESMATQAIAIAANTSSGLNQWPHNGGSEMYFHPAFAARNALTAVLLAKAGAFASEDIIEGEAGLFAAYGRRKLEEPIELFADGEFEIMAVYTKPAPACNFGQTPCQAALEAADHLDTDSSSIQQVTIRVPEASYLYPGCNAIGPFSNALQAKMSIQFSVAAVLANGAIAEANYGRIDDPEILRLVAATELHVDPELSRAFPAAQGAEVELTLKNGSRISRSLEDVIPATGAEVRSRFHAAATEKLGQAKANAIEDFVDGLENESDAGRLGALCALAAQ